MSTVIEKHLEAITASVHLLLAQLDALRHALQPTSVPTARVALPDRCVAVAAKDCALRAGEWDSRVASLTQPKLVMCMGCGYECEGGVGA